LRSCLEARIDDTSGMSRRSEFVDLVVEQMARVGRPRVRAMFGGHGIFQDDRFFAIIVADTLYLKTDAATRNEFVARGLKPFTFVARGKSTTTSYFEAPPEVFEDAESMHAWVQKALGAAARAAALKARSSAPGPARRKPAVTRTGSR
jgi:DNA transformation protein